jgi:hypothetical protein
VTGCGDESWFAKSQCDLLTPQRSLFGGRS